MNSMNSAIGQGLEIDLEIFFPQNFRNALSGLKILTQWNFLSMKDWAGEASGHNMWIVPEIEEFHELKIRTKHTDSLPNETVFVCTLLLVLLSWWTSLLVPPQPPISHRSIWMKSKRSMASEKRERRAEDRVVVWVVAVASVVASHWERDVAHFALPLVRELCLDRLYIYIYTVCLPVYRCTVRSTDHIKKI